MKNNRHTRLFANLRILTFCAMMVAISAIFGVIAREFMTFMGGQIRITFENIPIVLCGILFGPIVGGIVGLASDIIASIATSQNINLFISLGAALVGVFSGITSLFFKNNKYSLSCISLSDFMGELFGSVIFKTIGIVILYSNPIIMTLLYRSINYLGMAILEIAILRFILKNKSITSLIEKIKGKK